jgi:hypothetical protein
MFLYLFLQLVDHIGSFGNVEVAQYIVLSIPAYITYTPFLTPVLPCVYPQQNTPTFYPFCWLLVPFHPLYSCTFPRMFGGIGISLWNMFPILR